MKILIVDDDADTVSSLKRIILTTVAAGAGVEVEVECASNGLAAVEKCRVWKPQSIIMDIRMPVMDGLDACAEIRRIQPEARIVLMTGYHETPDPRLETVRAGKSVKFLTKPVNLESLMKFLRKPV